MYRTRSFFLFAACFLAASAAWADDLGYVDCNSHPEGSQLYGKPRQSQDTLGTVPCGERFAVLVNGFIFSRIQTADNKVGYVLSSLISVDHNATSLTQANAGRTIAPARAVAASAPASQPAPAQPQPVQAQVTAAASAATPAPAAAATAPATNSPATLQASAPNSSVPSSAPQTAANAATGAATVTPTSAVAPTNGATTVATASAAPASAPNAQPAAEPSAALPTPPPPPEAQPAAAQPQPTPSMLTPPPPASASAQPGPPAAAQPEAEPASAPVRDASVRSTWERPIPGAHRVTLLEFFGGFSFARFDNGGGYFNNMIGGLGSFGINLTSWLQVTGDSSYNFVTVSGTKNVLYGNHFGPRVYYRKANRWGITPFGEALVGGSRIDSTTAGTTTSTNCISYKFGGGVDMRASRHFEIRVLDFDYYRTAFGTNLHQNSYSVSAGLVLRLFGGATQ